MSSHGPVMRSSAGSPRLLGQINDHIVLGLLLEHGPLTRAQIGEHTGLSKPTVSALLDRLDSRELISPAGVVTGGPGPKAQIYQVNAGAAHVIAIHVEQHGSLAALASLTGKVLARFTVNVPQRRESDPRDESRRAIEGVLAAAQLSADHVDQIVVATPGVIDPLTGALRHARHLHGWEAPGLREQIEQAAGIPVSHGNDVNLAAVAEGLSGAAQDHDDYALLWLGRGVGLGLVMGGSLRAGSHGGAGEIGYLPIPGLAELPRVDRGAAGSFQQQAGGQGIRALAKKYGIRAAEPSEIVSHALNSAAAEGFLAELATAIAHGVASVATLIDPGLIVLGGPVALAGGDMLLESIHSYMTRYAFVRPPLVLSDLSDDAVLDGAIEVALQDVRSQLFGTPIASLLQ